MYSQILYFIIALLLFTIQQPGSQELFPLGETILLGVGIFLSFVLLCYLTFRPLKRGLELGLPLSSITLAYHRVQTRLSISALFALAAYVYALNIKFHLHRIPGLDESLTLSGLAGLILYLLHLGVIWVLSYPFHKHIYKSRITRTSFLLGHLSFTSAVLIPWLLISTVFDLIEMVNLPPFFNTAQGQFLLFGATLLIFVLFAPWLVVRSWGCKPLPDGPERENLEEFCREHRFTVGDFMYWPLFGGEILTAGVVGILPRLRYIMITKGLLILLDKDEVTAVIAHEMGHVRRFHVLFYLIFFVCFFMLTYSFDEVILIALLKNKTLMEWAIAKDSQHLTLFSIFYTIPVLFILVVYFRYIFGFFLRNSERQADLYALRLVGHPFTLVSSLEKIGLFSGHIRDLPSWHHFSIRQRVELLLEAHKNPSVIKSHNQKLYGATCLFLAVVAVTIYTAPNLAHTKVVKQWRAEMETHLLERELSRSTDNPDLYAAYGGLLMELGRFENAESVLKKAYELAPQDATVLNNLAWFYATAPSPYTDPPTALKLAREAAALDPEPHILDTLAEAYYANRRYEDALDAIRKALSRQPKNREYFLEQMRKFEKALAGRQAG
jgi:Zn-dependent protease with chaperone function